MLTLRKFGTKQKGYGPETYEAHLDDAVFDAFAYVEKRGDAWKFIFTGCMLKPEFNTLDFRTVESGAYEVLKKMIGVIFVLD